MHSSLSPRVKGRVWGGNIHNRPERKSSKDNHLLRDRLKPTIQSKYQGLFSKGVVLLHDNACIHAAAHTAETL
jgi:hypothetical protein